MHDKSGSCGPDCGFLFDITITADGGEGGIPVRQVDRVRLEPINVFYHYLCIHTPSTNPYIRTICASIHNRTSHYDPISSKQTHRGSIATKHLLLQTLNLLSFQRQAALHNLISPCYIHPCFQQVRSPRSLRPVDSGRLESAVGQLVQPQNPVRT